MSRRPDVHVSPPPLPTEKADEVRDALKKVLESHHFRGSRRCQLLLQQITEQTLLGDAKSLKERTLGITVFGRAPDYDTGQDPVVRSTAAEVRKKLAQYYQEPGHESEARIDLTSGSYIVEFHFNHASPPAAANPDGPVQIPEAPPPALTRLLPSKPAGIAAISTGIVLLVAVVILTVSRQSNLDRFWAPVLKTPGPVLICVGQPIAYNLKSAAAQDAIQAEATMRDPVADEGAIPKKDLVILPGRYVALGDSICLIRLTSFLGRFAKPYRIRGERSTTFADLRENATVLVAAFDNQWTQRAIGPLRFTFAKDIDHATDMIRDSHHPENTDWRLVGAWPHFEVSHDYVVVTRVLRGPTDHPILIAAGITEYGTRAAGEFLSTPEYFEEVVPKLTKNWETRNVQIVLYVPVVSQVPGHPQILATYVW